MDKNLEAAMIKISLLFGNKPTQKRDVFFQKKLLADLFQNLFDSVDGAMKHLAKGMPEYAIDKAQVISALKGLERNGFVNLSDDGHVTLSKKAAEEGEEYADKQRENFDSLVNDIYDDISKNVPKINSSAQVRQNVKNCLEYYIQTSCLKFVAVDEVRIDNIQSVIEQIASDKLPKDERLISQILLSIGSVIDNPSDRQRQTLETMARAQITMRLMGIDPMLQSFKRTVISNKVFVVDTDFLLYLITDNGDKSRQYKSLLKQLLDSGCEIYVPDELFDEVYDHAEAAKKMYHYISPILADNVGKWAEYKIKNVLLASYYKEKAISNATPTWETFINNYFRPKEGVAFTKDVVIEKVGKYQNIHYGHFPYNYDIYSSTKEEDIIMRDKLFQKALEVTLRTEKAENRDETKNNRIAKNDTKLFLNVKWLNDTERSRNGGKKSRTDFLCHRYYVLTNTFRIYSCTKELGIDDRLYCSPSALMAFMVEAGIMRNNMDCLSLFDNPFLTYIAEKSWDEVEKMVQTGIDFRGKSIVALRYDLQDYLQDLLTAPPDTEPYHKAVESVEEKGYKFNKHIEYAKVLEKQKDDLLKQREDLLRQNEMMQKKMERMEAERRKAHYQARVGQNKKKKK